MESGRGRSHQKRRHARAHAEFCNVDEEEEGQCGAGRVQEGDEGAEDEEALQDAPPGRGRPRQRACDHDHVACEGQEGEYDDGSVQARVPLRRGERGEREGGTTCVAARARTTASWAVEAGSDR